MVDEHERRWIGGFWRRVFAFFLDGLFLGLIGFLLGLGLESAFMELGAWSRLVGLLIGLAYFGVGNSSLAGGQTIGKRVLKLRVVDGCNETINVGKSVLRYAILGIPVSLNGAPFPAEVLFSFWIYPVSLVLFGGLFSTIYLLVFNRVTRQSLHDVLLGTFVVNADAPQQETGPIWRFHYFVVAAIFLLATVAPAFTGKLAGEEPFKSLTSAMIALESQPDVSHVKVVDGFSTVSTLNDGATTTTYVDAQVFLFEDDIGNTELARHLAQVLYQNYSEAHNRQVVQLTLVYGYDIGIWSKWSSQAYTFSPGELAGAE